MYLSLKQHDLSYLLGTDELPDVEQIAEMLKDRSWSKALMHRR